MGKAKPLMQEFIGIWALSSVDHARLELAARDANTKYSK
jgi:hypothetical protein